MKNIFRSLLVGSILTTGIFLYNAYGDVRKMNDIRLEICKEYSLNEKNLRKRKDFEGYFESHPQLDKEKISQFYLLDNKLKVDTNLGLLSCLGYGISMFGLYGKCESKEKTKWKK